ncbi:hypothetical protein, partial [Actinomadura sp. CNU-125]|uniref:hypothetical protein n=1 Tax=Actinomadura sp. CNU-125 TaxID=1904961 RepID=UPI001177B6E2
MDDLVRGQDVAACEIEQHRPVGVERRRDRPQIHREHLKVRGVAPQLGGQFGVAGRPARLQFGETRTRAF